MKLAARLPRHLAYLLFVCVFLATGAAAQKLGNEYFVDQRNGFRFKIPKEWTIVPVQASMEARGIVGQIDGKSLATKIGSNQVHSTKPDIHVFVFKDRAADSESGEGASGLRGRVKKEEVGRSKIEDVIPRFLGGLRDYEKESPFATGSKTIKKIEAEQKAWKAFTGIFDISLESWTFHLPDRDVCILFTIADQHYQKWSKVFGKAAKSFQVIERVEASELGTGYEDIVKFHREEAERTPGWRLLTTPSKNFVIKTSSDNDRFLGEVIERLEKSRELFERDFPPRMEMDHVSVVRVCDTEEEFHSYGGTGGGTAGWFSPRSKELVLYDAVEYDRNMTYAVMTHEAFHQYCHFMFEESEAHRWFDEGHGDYYGGVKFSGSRAKVTARMPAGLNRLGILKDMIREEKWMPIKDHINYSHPEWQSKGIRSYAQSWSIVYMLRQGALGKVSKKVWKKEYANIIPNYIETLLAGFSEAYGINNEAKDASDDSEVKKVLKRVVDLEKKQEIWKKAIEASWGQIDLDEFQENWLLYCDKYLKD